MSGRIANLVDPFVAYHASAPSDRPWRFIVENLKPFRWVLIGSLLLTVIGASLEVWLIGYTSALVDILAATEPTQLWTRYGLEFIVVALVVLIGRPLFGYLREALDDIAFRPNAEAMIAWRAHRHVTRQSVGWFRNGQSGRIASQVWAIGGSAVGAAYSVVHTLAYVTIYVFGSVGLMASIDLRLTIPLLVWVAAYLGFMAFIVPRIHKASGTVQEEYSRLTGLLVDSYANIDIIKLFASADADDVEAQQRFAAMRNAVIKIQSLEVLMNSTMLLLGSAMIVGLVGYTLVLWQSGEAPIGLVAAALALSFRITGMAEWMLDAVSSLFGYLGYLRETLKTVAQPLAIVDAPDATELKIAGGAIAFRDVTHRYGKDDGG
ncbi:MAG: ABC transporter ATP-binding protein, partial [Hyphomicrobiales bacterium]